ncbi:helix-turn-helix domain-containing protein [Peribacillus muralis]|uniref:helix-turn-helix domain-containing protein n=1 Tax=Peribacillus muralis TaxID=264697 RepID=UPI00366EE970
MGLVERIKFLCNERKVTFAEVERKVGISNGQIRRWDKSSPNIENVKKISEYFDVSVDYLLGRTDKKRYVDTTENEEKDIQNELQRIINGLNSNVGYAGFDGQTLGDLDEEDRELLIASLENSIRLARRIAKHRNK